MSVVPMDNLELRALEERKQLHERAAELKSKLSETRENLSIDSQSRKHFGAAAAVAGVTGILAGFTFAGFFTRR